MTVVWRAAHADRSNPVFCVLLWPILGKNLVLVNPALLPMSGIAPVGKSSFAMLFLLPGEDGRDGVVPDRSDDDAGNAGEPPDLVPGKDVAGDADIRDRAEDANRIEGEQAPQQRQTAQAAVPIGEEICLGRNSMSSLQPQQRPAPDPTTCR